MSAWIETKNRGRSALPEVIEEEYAEIEELAKAPACTWGRVLPELMLRDMRGGAASDPLDGMNCVTMKG